MRCGRWRSRPACRPADGPVAMTSLFGATALNVNLLALLGGLALYVLF